MDSTTLINLLWAGGFVALLLAVVLSRRAKKHGGAYRAGVAGAMYEFQNRDKQRALDLIVEERAAATRPEYPDGNLPDLEAPRRKRRGSGVV